MPIDYEDIKVEESPSAGGHTEWRHSHPAFGQVLLSRIQSSGNKRLYGSAIGYHPHSITLSIRRSDRIHNLSRDWHFGRGELIEVELSASQFAEMLTRMNMGEGVPCTIRRYNKKMIPHIPYEDKVESERICDGFRHDLKEQLIEIREATEQLDEILAKKSINKGDRENIRRISYIVERFLIDHAPFMVDSFNEATDKVTIQAKKEVESFVHMVAERTGFEAIKQMTGAQKEQALLPPKEE